MYIPLDHCGFLQIWLDEFLGGNILVDNISRILYLHNSNPPNPGCYGTMLHEEDWRQETQLSQLRGLHWVQEVHMLVPVPVYK